MEFSEFIITLFVIVAGILYTILFFKIWGMTNNIAQIKEYIEAEHLSKFAKSGGNDSFDADQGENPVPDWVIGSRVVRIVTEEQMKITSLNSNGTFVCAKAGGIIAGSFRRDELMTWNEWIEHIKKK